MDFGFIFKDQLRRIAERDYAELQRLDPLLANKSVITLSALSKHYCLMRWSRVENGVSKRPVRII